ncbi:MAG: glycosyltransferase [Pseudomonadota bacterium]
MSSDTGVARPFRVGLYGGMANNMYVYAHALSSAGYDIVFVRDRNDNYPFSQPVWEDVRLTVPSTAEKPKTAEDWSREEDRLGWRTPKWLVDPLVDDPPVPARWPSKRLFRPGQSAHRAILRTFISNPMWARALGWLQSCNALMVCGFIGEQLAYLSGRPYAIWPHGGDIRSVCNYPAVQDTDPDRRYKLKLQSCLSLAFREASWIGSHDPTAVGGSFCDVTSALFDKSLSFLPIPIARRARPQGVDRHELRKRLFEEIQTATPEARFMAFVPSRVEFGWKGHDRLLRGAAGIRDVHFVFAGWGGDYDRALAMAAELGLSEQVTFLPVAMSKPVLFDMYAASDFVIDQFTLSTYGTSLAEAMAGSVPVMMYIDEAAFISKGWEPPPVLNCQSEHEIRSVLRRIVSGDIDLEAEGRRAGEWASRTHDPDASVPLLATLLSGQKRIG